MAGPPLHEGGNAVSGTWLVYGKVESSQVLAFGINMVRFLQQYFSCIAGISCLLQDR